jgi:phage gp46-like protein
MDAFIDPLTRDYVLATGAPLPDPAAGLANAVYLRLMTARGSYWVDASFGSRLHELQREKNTPRVALLARQYAIDALAPLLDDGRATTIDVQVEGQDGRLALAVQVTAASGERLTFTHPVTVI